MQQWLWPCDSYIILFIHDLNWQITHRSEHAVCCFIFVLCSFCDVSRVYTPAVTQTASLRTLKFSKLNYMTREQSCHASASYCRGTGETPDGRNTWTAQVTLMCKLTRVCVLQTCGLVLTVNSLQVALQFERREEVTETVRTWRRRVHASILLRHRRHMLLHVTHQPVRQTDSKHYSLFYYSELKCKTLFFYTCTINLLWKHWTSSCR